MGGSPPGPRARPHPEFPPMPHDVAAAPFAARAERPTTRRSHARLKLAGIAALVIGAAVVAIRLLGRAHDQAELKHWTAAQAVPVVSTVQPAADTGSGVLTLPGNL